MTIFETQTLRAAQFAALRADSFSFQWLRDGADIGSGSITLAITTNPAATVTVTEPAAAVFTAGAQGYTALLWQTSPNGTTGWTNITGATSVMYTIPATDFEIHDGLFYRMSATDGTTTVYTTASALTVNEGGAITQVTGNYPTGFTVPMGETYEVIGAVTSPASLEVHGTLKMRAGAKITFTNVDESAFIGSVASPGTSGTPTTDVGLWIHEMGTLDMQGTPKTAWTHLAGAVVIGATTVTLEAVPTNWAVGDWIVIAPTEQLLAADSSATRTTKQTPEERRIKAIAGAVITLGSVADHTVAASLSKNHPTYTYYDGFVGKAEVLNLTRDVNINGTVTGRAHLMIHSQAPVHCSWFAMDYMGPNRDNLDHIIGRWAFHMHLLGDYCRGTVIEGGVVTRAGTHAFVPHGSNGVRLQDCIGYNCLSAMFWWDRPGAGLTTPGIYESVAALDRSIDNIWDRCVAALGNYLPAGGEDLGLSGFEMVPGKVKTVGNKIGQPDGENLITNSVAFGILGKLHSSGFSWSNIAHGGTWNIHNCVSHHNRRSQNTWTNTPKNELSSGFRSYHTLDGTRNGAYGNDLSWEDSFFEAAADSASWEDHPVSSALGTVTVPPYSRFGLGLIHQRNALVGGPGQVAMVIVKHNAMPEPQQWSKFIDCAFKPGAGAIGAILVHALDNFCHQYEFTRPTFVLPGAVPAFWFEDQPLVGEPTSDGYFVGGGKPGRPGGSDPARQTRIFIDTGTVQTNLYFASHPEGAANGWTLIPAWNCWQETL